MTDLPGTGDAMNRPSPSRRNPPWERRELVLALDLFVSSGSTGGNPILDDSHPDVIALSDLLRWLSTDDHQLRPPSFRSPQSVALKLANFRAVDRDLALERGDPAGAEMPGGMPGYSVLDRQVFEEFIGQPAALALAATAVRTTGSPIDAPQTEIASIPVGDPTTQAEDSPALPLIRRYAQWMAEQGISVGSHRYQVEGEPFLLVTDIFVPDLALLIQAKARNDRASVHSAIGELVDFRRFVPGAHLAVLLPHEPIHDHQALLRSMGIGWLWPEQDVFMDSVDGAYTAPSNRSR